MIIGVGSAPATFTPPGTPPAGTPPMGSGPTGSAPTGTARTTDTASGSAAAPARTESGFAGLLAGAVESDRPVRAAGPWSASAKAGRKPKSSSAALDTPYFGAAFVPPAVPRVVPPAVPSVSTSSPSVSRPSAPLSASPSVSRPSAPLSALPSVSRPSAPLSALPSSPLSALPLVSAPPSLVSASPSLVSASPSLVSASPPIARPESANAALTYTAASGADSQPLSQPLSVGLPVAFSATQSLAAAVLPVAVLPVLEALSGQDTAAGDRVSAAAAEEPPDDADLPVRGLVGSRVGRAPLASVAPRALVPSEGAASQAATPKPSTLPDASAVASQVQADVPVVVAGPNGWAPDEVDPDAPGASGVLVSVSETAVRVQTSSASVTAPHSVESSLPELPAPAIPDHLRLSVRDPLGDWTLDVRRHEHGLDLLFSAPGSLAPVVAGAEHDLRALLASHGHSLASLDFQDQGRQGGREAPHTPESAQHSLGSRASRVKKTDSDSTGPGSARGETRGEKGINLNRVA